MSCGRLNHFYSLALYDRQTAPLLGSTSSTSPTLPVIRDRCPYRVNSFHNACHSFSWGCINSFIRTECFVTARFQHMSPFFIHSFSICTVWVAMTCEYPSGGFHLIFPSSSESKWQTGRSCACVRDTNKRWTTGLLCSTSLTLGKERWHRVGKKKNNTQRWVLLHVLSLSTSAPKGRRMRHRVSYQLHKGQSGPARWW